jgi:hypothetical protein
MNRQIDTGSTGPTEGWRRDSQISNCGGAVRCVTNPWRVGIAAAPWFAAGETKDKGVREPSEKENSRVLVERRLATVFF